MPHLRGVPDRIVIAMDKKTALIPLLMVLLMSSAPLSGCFGKDPASLDSDVDHWLPPVEERSGMLYDDTDVFSRVSWNGSYEIDEVRSVYVPIPGINPTDGGAGVTGGAEVHLGLWLPVIDGCDWDAGSVTEGCQVPVIAEIGPYYDDGDVDALTPADRLGRFLIENFVPHGFGVAQVSVFGTGESNHCMDLMGHDEQAGIKGAVDWLGMQPWSNGRVGAIGKSYDGSTPWNAAASGSEYLATIVPMSGLIGMHDLMWRNGSMEARGAIMHNGVYGSFGLDGDSGDIENACEGYIEGYYAGPAAYMTGDNLGWTGSDYWEERHFLTDALQNFQGSIYIIHGLQDWNVDPHMAFPTHQMAIDAGFDVKGLLRTVGPRLPRPLRGPRGALKREGGRGLPVHAEVGLGRRPPGVVRLLPQGQWAAAEAHRRGPGQHGRLEGRGHLPACGRRMGDDRPRRVRRRPRRPHDHLIQPDRPRLPRVRVRDPHRRDAHDPHRGADRPPRHLGPPLRRDGADLVRDAPRPRGHGPQVPRGREPGRGPLPRQHRDREDGVPRDGRRRPSGRRRVADHIADGRGLRPEPRVDAPGHHNAGGREHARAVHRREGVRRPVPAPDAVTLPRLLTDLTRNRIQSIKRAHHDVAT